MAVLEGVSNELVLNELFRNMTPNERVVLCSVTGDPGKAGFSAWTGVPWELGTPCHLKPKHNNYVAISSFGHNAKGEYRRRKDQFGGLHAIMIDDIGTKVHMDAIPRDLIPTLVVETSPGNYQASFFLQEPHLEQEECEDSIRQIIQKVTGGGVDPGMAGVTRVMRLPEGVNAKPKYTVDGKLWSCQTHLWRPDVRTTWTELRRAFGLVRHFRTYHEPDDRVMQERIRSYYIVKQGLKALGMIRRDGGRWMEIRCPWIEQHSDRGATGAAVNPPGHANGWFGGYKCHHGHCEQRGFADLEQEVGRLVVHNGSKIRGDFYGE